MKTLTIEEMLQVTGGNTIGSFIIDQFVHNALWFGSLGVLMNGLTHQFTRAICVQGFVEGAAVGGLFTIAQMAHFALVLSRDS